MSRLLNAFVWLASLLPMWVHYLVSDLVLYPVMYYIVGYRKRVVRMNLENAFPEKDLRERRKIERGFYHYFCDYIVENCKLYTISEANIKRRFAISGVEEMEKDLDAHGLVFLYIGHYANWEYLGSLPLWMQASHECANIYRPLSSKAFDDLFIHLRSRFGADCIPMKETLRRIMEFQRDGRKVVVGFVSDQSPKLRNTHLWVDFLNQETAVFTGTERIAKKVDAAVYFADITKEKRGHYHLQLRPLTSDVRSYPDFQVTEIYMQELEKMIRRNPNIWLWSHRRWKHKRPAD